MGKASEAFDELNARRPTGGELDRRNPFRSPPLRLKPDEVVTLDRTGTDQIGGVLDRLTSNEVGAVEFRLADEPTTRAVMVTVEHYVALASAKLAIEARGDGGRITADRRLVPIDLEKAGVEPVDPDTANWW